MPSAVAPFCLERRALKALADFAQVVERGYRSKIVAICRGQRRLAEQACKSARDHRHLQQGGHYCRHIRAMTDQ
jgi:hypothetical protein